MPTAYSDDRRATFWWDAVHAAVSPSREPTAYVRGLGRIDLETRHQRERTLRRLRSDLKALPFDQVEHLVTGLRDELGVTPPKANVLGWDRLRRLADEGVAICGHTRTHVHLDRVSPAAAATELAGCLNDLDREIGVVPPLFAYPGGGLTPEVVEVVRSAGIEAAFTTRRGTNRLTNTDPLLLRRINVRRRTGLYGARLQMIPGISRIVTNGSFGR